MSGAAQHTNHPKYQRSSTEAKARASGAAVLGDGIDDSAAEHVVAVAVCETTSKHSQCQTLGPSLVAWPKPEATAWAAG